jgi:radical SAM superfamily enzyme YgiQ (UPF0313 family)
MFPDKVMDMGLYKKIIDECACHKEIDRIILYMNNEPLTDPYLTDRIDYAKKRVPWASAHLLTNGLGLTETAADRLIDSKLDWIGISFHGIRKDTIEKAMGIPFDTALDRINVFIEKARAKKNIKEYVMVTFLKHKYLTTDEKNEAIDYWKKKGIERISYFEGPVSRAGNVKDLRAVCHKDRITGCGSIWADEMIHIVEDGKVVLCCMDWKREVVLGDLNAQTIDNIWNGKRKRVWEFISGKTDMPETFLCKRCEEAVVDAMPDILLVNLPPWGINVPPLGTACLSSYLRSKGMKTEILDMNIELHNGLPDNLRFLWSMNYAHWWTDRVKFSGFDERVKSAINALIDKVVDSRAAVIGISSVTNSSNLVLEEMVKRIKCADPSKTIVLGGINITVKEQRTACLDRIKEYVDYCVTGEGEEPLYALLSSIKNVKTEKIKGVLERERFFKDSRLDAGLLLDDLPYPTFEEFDLCKYKAPNCALMEFSRGCAGNCPFCSIKGAFPFFKSKSAEYIFDQIMFYKNTLGVEYISAADAALNGDIKVLDRLCDLLIQNNVSVGITGLAIPRREMTPDLLKKMKEAGFFRLEYGVESGSDKILKAMRKIFSSASAEKVVRDTHEAGIEACIYLMVGYPGEAEKEFEETKSFLKRNAGYISLIKSINPLYLITGSEIFGNIKKYGINFPSEHGEFNWSIPADNNTVDVRKTRIRELKRLASQLNIPYTEEAECIEFTNKSSEEILLVMTPPWEAKKAPLGLAYLSSFLKPHGVRSKIIDLNVRLFNGCDSEKKYLWDIATINSFTTTELAEKFIHEFREGLEDFISEACSSPAKIVGFSTTIASTGVAVYLAHQIKMRAPSKITIIGGPGCYWNTFIIDPERLVDIFVVGEGEKPLLEIVKRFNERGSLSDLSGIKGTVLCIDKEYHSFLPAEPTDIKTSPFPDFSEFNLEDYNKGNSYKPLPILISRGCINRCSFCIDHKMNYPFRVRDPRSVVEEIKFHSGKGRKDFELNDLLCNGNLRHLEDICDLIIKEKLDIKWTSYAVIRDGMTLELCRKMRQAGCRYICYGMESASDVVLKNMNKRYDSGTAEEVIRNTHNAGIETAINIIIGYPGDSEEEFRKTCAFVKRNRDYIDQVTNASTCFLMLDTDLMNNLEKFGVYFKQDQEGRPIESGSCKGTQQPAPNYREYYVAPDNTPAARALWLRRFLRLLNNVKIPWVIVNYVSEHDRDMVNFIQRIGNSVQTLKCRDFRLDLSNKGQCKIYYNNIELTRDVGMNVSFFIDDRWVDSASAEWRIKQNSMSLEIDIIWPGLPIAQKWVIRFGKKDKSIDWKIKVHFNDDAKIFQHKIGVMLTDEYNRYSVNGSMAGFPKAHKDKWDDILFSAVPGIGFMSDSVLPDMVIETEFKQDLFLQLQNTPSNLFARMANFCLSSNNHPHPGVFKDRAYEFKKGDILEGRIKVYLKP